MLGILIEGDHHSGGRPGDPGRLADGGVGQGGAGGAGGQTP